MISNPTPANRPATLDEMERARHAMTVSPGMVGLEREFLGFEIAQVRRGEVGEHCARRPQVIHDFYKAMHSDAQFLLVPPGAYCVPVEFFKRSMNRCIIGMGHDKPAYPTLILQGLLWQNTGAGADCAPKMPPRVIETSGTRFLNLRIDAHLPTVLEIGDIFMHDFLAEHLQYVEYGQNIEVLDALEGRLCIGRSWARAAYGPECHMRVEASTP